MKIKENENLVYQAILLKEIEIDSEGRIWRIAKRGWDRWKHQVQSRKCKRVRAENATGTGYLQIRSTVNRERIHALAHRLVWLHFNGPIPTGLTINHKNGNKADNRPENLELATYSEQVVHALHVLHRGRTDQYGEMNSMSKLTSTQVAEIRERRKRGEKLASIARDYGIRFQSVSKIVKNQRWTQAISG